jgi:hypothetical protein
LCVYDGAAGPIASAAAPAGGLCNARRPRPCWKETGGGVRYANGDLTPDGLQRIDLRAGPDGKAKIVVKGKGEPLALPPLPILALPVTVQLVASDGACWEATYGGTLRNQPDRFKARSE